jgi:hypothetical protein
MARTYIVQQGDHLSGIAEANGFANFGSIWDHPNNASLKGRRKSPHVLFPGDELYIPDKVQKIESCATTKVHRFQVNRQKLKLRIVLKDFDEKPIANADCVLIIEGSVFELKSDGQGLIEAVIPRAAQNGTLQVPSLDVEYPVKIGHLDPLEGASGCHARLTNLGYHAGSKNDGDEELLRHAIEEYQCDHKLKVTGELDAATRDSIKKVHGI